MNIQTSEAVNDEAQSAYICVPVPVVKAALEHLPDYRRWNLRYIHFDKNNMVCTNGHIMFIYRHNMNIEVPFSIPKDAILNALKIAPKGRQYITFQKDKVDNLALDEFEMSMLYGEKGIDILYYPYYQSAMPKTEEVAENDKKVFAQQFAPEVMEIILKTTKHMSNIRSKRNKTLPLFHIRHYVGKNEFDSGPCVLSYLDEKLSDVILIIMPVKTIYETKPKESAKPYNKNDWL